jgi:hypothetical protein
MGTSASCGLISARLPAAFLKSGRIPLKSADNLNENHSRNSLLSHHAALPFNTCSGEKSEGVTEP